MNFPPFDAKIITIKVYQIECGDYENNCVPKHDRMI